VLQAPLQGDICSESRRAAEQDFSEGREKETAFTQRLCRPFPTLAQEGLVAPQGGSHISTSNFYAKTLFWPGICFLISKLPSFLIADNLLTVLRFLNIICSTQNFPVSAFTEQQENLFLPFFP